MLHSLRPTGGGWLVLGATLVAVAVALLLSAILISTTGGSPADSVDAVWTGSVATATSWSTTLLNTAPLLLVAVGACVSARSGTFNIGQEGQVLIGAFAGAYVALRLSISGPLLIILVIVAAGLAGGVWAGLSAVMLRLRGVNVVVSTLLMSFLAQQVVSYAVTTQWFLQETAEGSSGIANSQSNPMPASAKLGSTGAYPGLQLNVGLLLAVLATVVVAVALARTRWGFRLTMLGLNPVTARHTGVRVALMGGLALAISGALAGVAGAVLVTSPVTANRLDANISDYFGWDGLLVALVARNRPVVCVPVALLFGILRAGGDFLSATGIPYYLVDISKGLLVLAVVAPPVVVSMLQRRSSARRAAQIVLPENITTKVEAHA